MEPQKFKGYPLAESVYIKQPTRVKFSHSSPWIHVPPGTRRKCHDVSAKNRARMQKHQTLFCRDEAGGDFRFLVQKCKDLEDPTEKL